MLFIVGLGVLIVLGVISGEQLNRAWVPDASALQLEQFWRTEGGMEGIRYRADLLSSTLLALGAQYGWQLAGLMLIGAALMRSGWLKGQFSPGHYRRAGVMLVLAGMAINLPSIILQWHLNWDYCWVIPH